MTTGMAMRPNRDLRQPVSLERVRGIEPPSEAWEAILTQLKSLDFFKSAFDFSVLEFGGGS
jgi:hypothetical protein